MTDSLKVDVEKSLPPKKEIKLFVGMSAMQKQWYSSLLVKDLELLNGSHLVSSFLFLIGTAVHLQSGTALGFAC